MVFLALMSARMKTGSCIDAVWSEMPVEWTDVGDSVFSLNEVKRVLGDRG